MAFLMWRQIPARQSCHLVSALQRWTRERRPEWPRCPDNGWYQGSRSRAGRGVSSRRRRRDDLRDPAAASSVVGATVARFGRLDLVINNAGGSPPSAAAEVSPRFVEKIV